MNPDTDAIRAAIANTLTLAFPEFISRLIICSDLYREASELELKLRMFGSANHGKYGDQLSKQHRLVAEEFNTLRYWFMSPIKPLDNWCHHA